MARGFSLIEVLVALLVLSAGVVGATATQMSGMRSRRDSALMSRAVQVAAVLADAMRANRAIARLPDAANPYLAIRFDGASDGAPPAAPCFAPCTAARLAQHDAFEAARMLAQDFPAGRILVCRDAKPWDASASALAWRCASEAGAPIVIKVGWRAPGDAQAIPRVALAVGEAP